MAKLFLGIILIFLSLQLDAQRDYRTDSKKAISNYEEGLSAYRMKEYAMAARYLMEAIEQDENFQNAYMVLAEVFWDRREYESAIEYYKKGVVIDSSFYPRAFLNIARLSVRIGNYTDALENYQTLLEYESEGTKAYEEAARGIAQSKFAIKAVANPVEFKPESLGPNINSPEHEYWPSLSADGNTLVITRLVSRYEVTMGNYQQEDFYYSKREDTGWTRAVSLGPPLNTPDNEGAQSISADGRTMVYTVCNRMGVIGRCDIYMAKLENGKWTESQNMGTPLNSTAKETQPSLNADGTIIYFASDKPGGKGGLDIYMSKLDEEGNWSEPENLGDSINTPEDEMSPFIHHDNKTLYFSSAGHLGMGGFDLFRAEMNEQGKWTKATNLGYPINTYGDEIGMIVNAKGNIAYYASDVTPASGRDIYQFELYEDARPQEVSYLKGTVFDEESRKRMRAKFELYDLADGSLVSQSESDERTGEFLICIPTNRDYMLNIAKPGYLFYSDNFALEGVHHLEEPFHKDIPLKPIKSGQSIVLKNIFYETDSYALRDESKYELEKLIKFLELNANVHIEISGHTDNVGTEAYNSELSEKRAQSVVNYLEKNGISASRLTYKGYGFSQPIDTNETPEGRAKNRRTELKIMN